MAQCSADWDLILEYLKVMFSGPVVSFVIFLIAVLMFGKEIRAKINDLKSLDAPGVKAGFTLREAQATPPINADSDLSVMALPASASAATPSAPTSGSAPAASAPTRGASPSPGPTISAPSANMSPVAGGSSSTQFGRPVVTTNDVEQLTQVVQQLREHLEFEQVYGVLYGSQLEAIVQLARSGGAHPLTFLQPFVDTHVKRTEGAVWAFRTLDDFMRVFVVSGFAREISGGGLLSLGKAVQITAKGLNFVTYITSTRQPARPW